MKSRCSLVFDDNGSGLPVVLLHGFPLCRAMWQPQVQSLVEAGYRVVTPDLRGYGESPVGEGAVTMSRYADDVIALLDQLKIDRAVIGGMSMGGYVLCNLLERYPQRVCAAMFIVTRAAADDAEAKQRRTKLAGDAAEGRQNIIADAFQSVLFGPAARDELKSQVRDWMLQTSSQGMADGLIAMRDREDSIANLANFKLPSLVIGAEQDLAVPLGHSHVLNRGLPQGRLVTIADAGHMVNLERPDPFNRAVLEFLAEMSS